MGEVPFGGPKVNGSEQSTQSEDDVPSEVIVPSDWAETMYSKGQLSLSDEQVGRLGNADTILLPRELMEAFKTPKEGRRPTEWIEPLDAVHLLAPHVGGDANAKSAIAERLRDGVIECHHVWLSEGPDLGPLSTRRPQVTGSLGAPNPAFWVLPSVPKFEDRRLGGAFWNYSDRWEKDIGRWDWPSGLFVASRDGNLQVTVDGLPIGRTVKRRRIRMVVSGIRFHRADIEALANVYRTPAIAPTGNLADASQSRQSAFDPSERPKLPFGVPKYLHKYEECAHLAAEIIRMQKVTRAEAFRRVAPHYPPSPNRSAESKQRAVRQAFELMYDLDGTRSPD